MKLRNLYLSLAALFCGALELQAQATYFVDGVNGSDANPGVTPALAFATIGFAVSTAAPGSTINVLPATYNESLLIDKPGLKLEALSSATIDPLGGIAITIVPSTVAILRDTVVRGFTIVGANRGVFIGSAPGLPLECSPTIEMNTFIDNNTGIDVAPSAPGSFSLAVLRYNKITVTPPVGCSRPNTFGITIRPGSSAGTAVQVRSNHITLHEWAIGVFTQSGVDFSSIECNVMAYNEWGMYVNVQDPASILTVVNNTIADAYPASAVITAYGIQSVGTNFVFLENNIVWLPDVLACGNQVFGRDLDGANIFLGTSNRIEDLMPTPAPGFVSPTIPIFDYHLLPTSPAIDVGNTGFVAPTGAHPVDFDRDGGPRIIDAFRDTTMFVDQGAHEYTTVDLNLVDPADVINSSGRPYVNWRAGGSITFNLTGTPGDIAFLWWNLGSSYGTNVLFSALGNLLAPLGVSPLQFTVPPSGLVSFTIPMPPGLSTLQELEFHMQGLLLRPGVFGPYRGAFTRRVILEVNQ